MRNLSKLVNDEEYLMGEPILIVEDNRGNLKLLKLFLTGEGYDIRTATDAYEAMELLKTFRPRIIMMDIQLPGKDGLQLSRELKSNPEYKEIIIIALTAYAMKDDKEKILATGCDDYISKPIDIKTLPDLIKRHLKTSVTS
jgi:CheY-like chemotaxis protein